MTVKHVLTSGVAAVSAAGLVAASAVLPLKTDADAVVPTASVSANYRLTGIQDIDPGRALNLFFSPSVTDDHSYSGQYLGNDAMRLDGALHWDWFVVTDARDEENVKTSAHGTWAEAKAKVDALNEGRDPADRLDYDDVIQREVSSATGPEGAAYYIIDQILPNSIVVDDYFFTGGDVVYALIYQSVYGLAKAVAGREQAISLAETAVLPWELLQDPLGALDLLGDDVGGVVSLPLALLSDPLGALDLLGEDVGGAVRLPLELLSDPFAALDLLGEDVGGTLALPLALLIDPLSVIDELSGLGIGDLLNVDLLDLLAENVGPLALPIALLKDPAGELPSEIGGFLGADPIKHALSLLGIDNVFPTRPTAVPQVASQTFGGLETSKVTEPADENDSPLIEDPVLAKSGEEKGKKALKPLASLKSELSKVSERADALVLGKNSRLNTRAGEITDISKKLANGNISGAVRDGGKFIKERVEQAGDDIRNGLQKVAGAVGLSKKSEKPETKKAAESKPETE